MNFDELFPKEIIIKAEWTNKDGTHDTFHYLREPTPLEDLEFRRKLANVKVRNREIQTSDVALNAPLSLYDKICQRVTVENGAGPEEIAQGDEVKKIPTGLKLTVINSFQNRARATEGEILGN